MRKQIGKVAVVALISAATATAVLAQGSVTQDPGNVAPGNLTTDRLGPSTVSPVPGANGRLGTSDMPNGNSPRAGYGSGTTGFHRAPGGGTGGVAGRAPDYGATYGGAGTSAPGLGATRNAPNGAGGTGAIGGGR